MLSVISDAGSIPAVSTKVGILDFVFPKNCLECHKEGNYICSGCLAKVRLAKPICPMCEKASIDGLTHIKCLKKFGLNGLTSVWEYEGVIRKAILALKYKYATEAGRELCGIFAEYIGNSSFLLPKPSVFVPIPIYWYRENQRGFNQSIEIGRKFAEGIDMEFISDLLIRSRSTKPQVELKGEERRQNLKGVFSIKQGFSVPPSVILFDDVYTTGSTLKEACKVLKRAGTEKVWGLTLAR